MSDVDDLRRKIDILLRKVDAYQKRDIGYDETLASIAAVMEIAGRVVAIKVPWLGPIILLVGKVVGYYADKGDLK